MRKIILLLVCTFAFVNIYNAECSYKELKELNILASYIESRYEYNEENGTFDVILSNVQNELYLVMDFKTYYPNDGLVRISGFESGQEIELAVYSGGEAECVTQYLRVIKVRFPYLNRYFESAECVGHETVEACSNRFLNYQLSKSTFNRIIADDTRRQLQQKEDENNDKQDNPNVTIMDVIKEFSKEYWLPVLLVVLSSLITFLICNVIYRRVKHGF